MDSRRLELNNRVPVLLASCIIIGLLVYLKLFQRSAFMMLSLASFTYYGLASHEIENDYALSHEYLVTDWVNCC